MFKLENKSVCFTGHRKIRKKDTEIENNLYKIIEDLIHKGFLYFYAGGAKGFDALASKTVIKLKEKYTNIKLILVLPFYNQYEKENNWTIEEINEYNNLKNSAHKIIYTQETYSAGCYYKRNRFLIDHSDICLCYKYKNSGGTSYTINYAENQNLKIINII